MALTKVSYSMIDGATANVLDYGASPTATAAANAAAFTAALATGNSVFVPEGTYDLNPITILNGASLFGAGKAKTTLVPQGSSPVIDWDYDTNGNIVLRNLEIRDIRFDLADFGTGPVIKLIGAQYCDIRDLIFHDTSGVGTALCIHLEFSYFINLVNIHLREIYSGIRLYGVDYNRGPNHNLLDTINGENTRNYAVRLDYARGNKLTNIDLEYGGNNVSYGIILEESSYNEISQFWYEANNATVADPAIRIYGTTFSTNKKNSLKWSAQIIHPQNAVHVINSIDTVIEDFRFVGGTVNIQDDSNTNLNIIRPQTESASVGLISAGASSVNTMVHYVTDTGLVQFTPSVTYSGGNGTLAYTDRQGWYSRNGRSVHVQGYIDFTKGTASGNLAIDLPFATVGISLMYVCPHVVVNGLTGATGQLQGYITPGSTSMVLYYGTGSITNVTDATTNASCWLSYSVQYII